MGKSSHMLKSGGLSTSMWPFIKFYISQRFTSWPTDALVPDPLPCFFCNQPYPTSGLTTSDYVEQVCLANQKMEDTNLLCLPPIHPHVRWQG
ncbi:hypothetical protein EXN66_Car020417 [Channa argus]|uniref:Uncharacterized protein n=1 Tax=Channa argus TaxID=215402 RepID=A0A6G1QQI2_CHAAH|nr:hypothetical protein EXN66_Car020417 [Channa argus]